MPDKKTPKPEEVQKEFEDFVRQRFGGSVQVFSANMDKTVDAKEPDMVEDEDISLEEEDFEFSYTPKEIKEHLDQYVIKQDEAKKALAIAVCDHYNHAKFAVAEDDYDYAKQNVLILGPTGVGKTYLIKKVAELIGVPFVKADATRFSETGFVGANVDDLIRDLVAQADGDIEKAKFGIVYLDEADKLASRGGSGNRDVNSRGVQFGLLRLMEESEVDLKSGNDIQSQMQALMDMQSGNKKPSKINTRHILFIVSGAFSGLSEIVNKRLNQSTVGFHRDEVSQEDAELHSLASTEDFIEYGFEAEFVGRLPIRVSCESLNAEDLESILSSSKGSILTQYQNAFKSYGIQMDVSPEAMKALAYKASLERTGARALMTACEQVLRHYKFELPSTDLEQFTLSEAMVQNPRLELQNLLQSITNTKPKEYPVMDEFEKDFFTQHDVNISLSQDFRKELSEQCGEDDKVIKARLKEVFEGYEHGLLLLRNAMGTKLFQIDAAILANPKSYLENLVLNHYENKSIRSSQGAQKSISST